MEFGKDYGIQEFCDLLQLKESRTKVILAGLIAENRIEIIGANKDRKYRRRNSND